MDFLPYAVTTDTGDTFDIEFPLSAHTEDSVRVHQLLTTLMNALASDLKVLGETSNGDILQAGRYVRGWCMPRNRRCEVSLAI